MIRRKKHFLEHSSYFVLVFDFSLPLGKSLAQARNEYCTVAVGCEYPTGLAIHGLCGNIS
jgi:hypothetical protein